jgi:uncharacterized protein
MRIVFATDLHGSELCFRKFINSAEFYKADVLVLGGDIVGKAICAIVDEGATYRSNLFGQEHVLDSEEALIAFEENVRFNGFYPYRCTPDELARMGDDPAFVQQLFVQAMLKTKRDWIQWADARLERAGVECYAITGNDDPYEVDEAFADSQHVHLINGKLVDLGEWQICGYPISNRTPWDSPREKDEDGIAHDLAQLCDPSQIVFDRLIMNVHVPPYGIGLDFAPELTADLRPKMRGGMDSSIPVGSHAVKEFIERYQPLLGLHGHVHESKSVARIDRTVCVNPGSRYNEGSLQAAIIELDRGKVKSHQLVAG